MARVRYSSIVSEISGSIGGATFQKSLYGNTLRSKPNPHKSGTQNQLSSRSILLQCQHAWQALTIAQRRQWDQFISFSNATIKRDNSITLTGHTLFIKYNYLRILSGLAIATTPGYLSPPSWPTCSGIRADYYYIDFLFSHTINDLGIFPVIKLSYIRPPSRSFTPSGLRFVSIYTNYDYMVEFRTAYSNIFGRFPNIGDTIHYSLILFMLNAPLYSPIQTGTYTITSH